MRVERTGQRYLTEAEGEGGNLAGGGGADAAEGAEAAMEVDGGGAAGGGGEAEPEDAQYAGRLFGEVSWWNERKGFGFMRGRGGSAELA